MMNRMYQALKASRSTFVPIRQLQYHVRQWGEPVAGQAPLVLVHGWMDVSASWQFMVDALKADRWIIAPDWRGFGLTRSGDPSPDSYWFPDYLADLDALLDAGYLYVEPLVYEDFLPVSAAGIFQSNLGDDAQAEYGSNANREAFEQALGATVADEFAIYERLQAEDIKQSSMIMASFVYHTAMRDEKLNAHTLSTGVAAEGLALSQAIAQASATGRTVQL